MKHWVGKLPNLKPVDSDENATEFDSVSFPFDLENFCRENDQYLALVPNTRRRKLFAKTILSPELGIVWAVWEGDECNGTRGKSPIAYFKETEDVNRFVFGTPISPEEREPSRKIKLDEMVIL